MSSDAPSNTVAPRDWSGHPGHLSPEQEHAFSVFKDIVTKAGLYKPDPAPSHDDSTLLRFLRARRFDPHKAHKQFSEAEAWRVRHNVDALYASFDPVEFEAARRFYPRWTGRRDKHGCPVYVFRLASLSGQVRQDLNAIPAERKYQSLIALYELMTRFMFPLCSALPHPTSPHPISSVTTIIDLEHVSLTTLWSLRNHLQESSVLGTAHYPETLASTIIVNSPTFFPTIWGWVKGWFDEGTRSKFHVLGKDAGPVLRTLIESRDLPQPYGGELAWKFEDEPCLDDAARALIGEMPRGPAIFVDGEVRRPTVPSEAPRPDDAGSAPA